MPNLTDIPQDELLARLRAATVDQIRTAMKNRINNMTKRQLIVFLMDAMDFEDGMPPATTSWPDGQSKNRLEITRDALGAKVRSRLTSWTYYPTSEVDTITIRERDASDVEVRQRRIKHFTDGRQPEIDVNGDSYE